MPGIFFAGTISQGAAGPQEARPAGELRGGPRCPLQRPASWPGTSPRRKFAAPAALRATDDPARRARRHAREPTSRRRPSCGTSGRISPGSSRSTRPTGRATRALVPLAAFVDGAGDDGAGDAVALTLEADGSGAIYPVALRPPRRPARRAHVRARPAAALRHARGPRSGSPRSWLRASRRGSALPSVSRWRLTVVQISR